ncbi:hypothetical protein BH10CHL1_BH10CHL1_25700 [soil metagenome]
MHQRIYRMGPVTVGMACVDDPQLAQLDELWQVLFQVQTEPANGRPPVIKFQFNRAGDSDTYPRAVELFHHAHQRLWQTPIGFHLTFGDTWLALDVAQFKATGMLAPSFWACPLAEQREFFQLALLLLLRRHSVYLLSANGIVPPSGEHASGMLLVGNGGAGKTTLALSLLTGGWRWVADEQLLLQSQPAGLAAYALRRGFACTPETTNAFPTLAGAQTGLRLSCGKTLLHLDRLFPDRFAGYCIPRVLLFPQIAHTPTSWLAPLDPAKTLAALLHQPRSSLLVDPPTVMGYLVLLKELVRQTRGYQLHLGQDVLEQPARVGELLLSI